MHSISDAALIQPWVWYMGISRGVDMEYNPRKKGQKSYHPVIAFVAETKEILHSWFRCGSAYTSNGVVEFVKECMAYMKKQVRVIFRGDCA